MNASLWIMAATWENEHNSNMTAARVLLQRALRLMPENEQLWHEYFRLELLYIEKIKLRRRVLGIDQKSQEKNIDDMDVDKEEDDNTIQLPAVTGEDVEQWKQDEEETKSKSKLDVAALEEENNPILQGLLAKIIYDNAIQAIPNNIEFRQRFVDIYREFTDTESHIQYVYETIRRDMSENATARAFLAARHLFVLEKKQDEEKSAYISVNDPLFVNAIRSCVEEFNSALKELNVPQMWEEYVKFLLNWYSIVTEENLKLYLCKLSQKTFKACQKQKKMSVEMYELWTTFMLDTKEDSDKIDAIAEEALLVYPQSVKIWIQRAQLEQDKGEQYKLYKSALNHNPESLLLWTSYKDWLIENDALSTEEKEKLFFEACEKATVLLPSVTATSSDRNSIKDILQSSYVEWAAESKGIDYARTIYKIVIKSFYPTYSFFMKCIEIENQFGDAKSGQENVEYLYDRTTRLEHDKQGKLIVYNKFLVYRD
jgi:U3 small nucleolar RNA-associated protein 6